MDFEYYIENGEVTITDYEDKLVTSLIIPEYIDGHPVVRIGYHILSSIPILMNLTIPLSVIDIDSHAFFNSNRLKTINDIKIEHDKINIINNRFVVFDTVFYKIIYNIGDGYCCDYRDNNMKWFIDKRGYDYFK